MEQPSTDVEDVPVVDGPDALSRPKPKRIWYFARLAFAVVLLVLVFRKVDMRAAGSAMREVNPLVLLAATALYIFIRYVFSLQMTFGLKPLGIPVTTGELFRFQMATAFYALILPGDIAAGGVFWFKLFRRAKMVYEPMALIVITRLINTLAMVMIGMGAMWYDTTVAKPQIRIMLVLIFLCAASVFLVLFSKRLMALVHRLGVWAGGLVNVPEFASTNINKLWTALSAFQKMRQSGSAYKVIALAFVVHLVGTCWFFLLAEALNLGVSIFVIGWIRVILALLQFMPITIAGLGVREATLVSILGLYGVDMPIAVAFALCIFAVQVAAGLIGYLIEISEGFFNKKHEVAA